MRVGTGLWLACVFALGMSVCEARAAEMNFDVVLKDAEGVKMTDCAKVDQTAQPPKCSEFVDLTASRVVRSVLNQPEQGLALDEQIRRGLLARAILRQPKQNLSVDDVKMIKDLVAKRNFTPDVLLGVLELIDPASLKKGDGK